MPSMRMLGPMSPGDAGSFIRALTGDDSEPKPRPLAEAQIMDLNIFRDHKAERENPLNHPKPGDIMRVSRWSLARRKFAPLIVLEINSSAKSIPNNNGDYRSVFCPQVKTASLDDDGEVQITLFEFWELVPWTEADTKEVDAKRHE